MKSTQRRTTAPSARPQCCYCGQPVRAGEPHWAGDSQGQAWHYGCAERAGLTLSWIQVRRRESSISKR